MKCWHTMKLTALFDPQGVDRLETVYGGWRAEGDRAQAG